MFSNNYQDVLCKDCEKYQIKVSANTLKVYKAFDSDQVRDDHYDSINGLYRLDVNATNLYDAPIFIKDNLDQTIKNIEKFVTACKGLEVIPSRIFVSKDSLNVSWESINVQILDSRSQYLHLCIDFVDYIDKIKFSKLEINTGMFSDCPVYEKPNGHIMPINRAVKFNKYCFGSKDGEIEVLYFW